MVALLAVSVGMALAEARSQHLAAAEVVQAVAGVRAAAELVENFDWVEVFAGSAGMALAEARFQHLPAALQAGSVGRLVELLAESAGAPLVVARAQLPRGGGGGTGGA